MRKEKISLEKMPVGFKDKILEEFVSKIYSLPEVRVVEFGKGREALLYNCVEGLKIEDIKTNLFGKRCVSAEVCYSTKRIPVVFYIGEGNITKVEEEIKKYVSK